MAGPVSTSDSIDMALTINSIRFELNEEIENVNSRCQMNHECSVESLECYKQECNRNVKEMEKALEQKIMKLADEISERSVTAQLLDEIKKSQDKIAGIMGTLEEQEVKLQLKQEEIDGLKKSHQQSLEREKKIMSKLKIMEAKKNKKNKKNTEAASYNENLLKSFPTL